MRNLIRSLVAVLIVSATLFACSKKQDATAATSTAPPPLPADVAAVESVAHANAPTTTDTAGLNAQASPTTDAASGAIAATGEFVSPVRSEVAPKIAGRVAHMYVDEGSRVSKGQALLDLETDYVRLNLQRAAADASRAKAALDDARRDVARKKELIASNSIPQATFDRSQSGFEQANAAYQSAAAQVALLRQQLADSTVRSPISGVVASKKTDVGQRLGDNTVAVIVTQMSPLKLRFRVPEKYLAQVRVGQVVRASVDPYPGEVFEGRVTVLGGVIDSATRAFLVETEFPNRDGKLRPGMFARVELVPGR